MDNYGIINLTELDKWIADYIHKRDGWKEHASDWEVYDLMVRELFKLKNQCAKLPSAQQVFDQGMFIQRRGTGYGEEKLRNANDYITNYKP